MKHVRFKGQQPTVFQNLGELRPDEVRYVTDAQAAALVGRGEFEVVVPPAKPAPKPETAVSKNPPAPRKLEADKTTGKP